MVRLRELRDDNYYFDEENYCLRGRKFGKVLTLGDKVRIEIKRADLVKKQLDFALVEIEGKNKNSFPSPAESERIKRNKNPKEQMKIASEKNTFDKKIIVPKESIIPKKPLSPDKLYNEEWGFEV